MTPSARDSLLDVAYLVQLHDTMFTSRKLCAVRRITKEYFHHFSPFIMNCNCSSQSLSRHETNVAQVVETQMRYGSWFSITSHHVTSYFLDLTTNTHIRHIINHNPRANLYYWEGSSPLEGICIWEMGSPTKRISSWWRQMPNQRHVTCHFVKEHFYSKLNKVCSKVQPLH